MSERKFITHSTCFGSMLRNYRLAADLSQSELTSKMHLYGSTLSSKVYSKIENGNNNMFIEDFIIFKIVLDFSFDDFFEDLVKAIKNNAVN